MIPSFSLLGSLHILQQQTNHHAPLPLRHSIHRSKTPHPTDLHAVQAPVETVLSLSHSCKLSPIVRGHISDVNRRVNGYGRHHSPTIRFRLHTCLEFEGLSLSILPPPAHSTMPCGISGGRLATSWISGFLPAGWQSLAFDDRRASQHRYFTGNTK